MRSVCDLLWASLVTASLACQSPSAIDTGSGAAPQTSSDGLSSGGEATVPKAPSPMAQTVTVTGRAPSSAESHTVTGLVIDASHAKSAMATATVQAGAFALTLDDAATSGNARVALFVDVNGDATCNIAPTDLGALAPIAADGTASVTLDANAQAPCSLFGDFDLTVSGSDFTPHNNQMMYAAVRDTKSDAYVTAPQGIKVTNNAWSLKLSGALVTGRAYELRYFADADATGVCQNHSWKTAVPAASRDVDIVISHETPQSPICTDFPPL